MSCPQNVSPAVQRALKTSVLWRFPWFMHGGRLDPDDPLAEACAILHVTPDYDGKRLNQLVHDATRRREFTTAKIWAAAVFVIERLQRQGRKFR
jgi:hypothetical protein